MLRSAATLSPRLLQSANKCFRFVSPKTRSKMEESAEWVVYLRRVWLSKTMASQLCRSLEPKRPRTLPWDAWRCQGFASFRRWPGAFLHQSLGAGLAYRLVRNAPSLDHPIPTWRSEVFLDQTRSPPRWRQAGVCEEPLQDAPKVEIKQNSYK